MGYHLILFIDYVHYFLNHRGFPNLFKYTDLGVEAARGDDEIITDLYWIDSDDFLVWMCSQQSTTNSWNLIALNTPSK